jgi:tetratricopeptide (TPR) repeat protein
VTVRVLVVMALLCTQVPLSALAQGSPTGAAETQARALVADGNKLYEAGQFEAALKLYVRAYAQVANPNWLFNMAQCHRELGRLRDAIRLYELYLLKVPATPDRADVEALIKELTERERTAKSVLPSTDAAPRNTLLQGSADRPSPNPWYRRWYVWAGIGAVIAGGVAAGVVLGTRSEGSSRLTRTFVFPGLVR